MKMPRVLRACPLAVCLAALPATAGPAGTHSPDGWTYHNLHPQSERSSWGQASRGAGLTVGFIGSPYGSDHHAAAWTSLSGDSVIDLHPSGFDASRINGSSGAQHVGLTILNGRRGAALWNGNSAADFVSLHPPQYRESWALGTDGEHQIGYGVTSTGLDRALLWSGSAGSVVSLHPPGADHSQAFDIGGGRQVGWVEVGLESRTGGYWEGTAESWTPLESVGNEFGETFVNSISPDGRQQGGWAASNITGVNWAAIWEGSTDTFRSLHPDPSMPGSAVLETDGTHQVGYVISTGTYAAIWDGTAESYFNLHSLLPDNYANSWAFDVFTDHEAVWVTGYAYNATLDRFEAVVWSRPVPAPSSPLALVAAALIAITRRSRHQARTR